MAGQDRRVRYIFELIKEGNLQGAEAEVRRLDDSVNKLQGDLTKLNKTVEDQSKTLGKMGQHGKGVSDAFTKAGDAAWHFGAGAMWLNLPMTNFIYTAGNLIQGVQWIHRGFTEVIRDLPPLAKGLMVGAVAVAGMGSAMVGSARAAESLISRMRTLGEVTGQTVEQASRMTANLAGPLGFSGSVNALQGIAARQAGLLGPEAHRQMGMAQAISAGGSPLEMPGLDVFTQLGVPLRQRGSRGTTTMRSQDDVFFDLIEKIKALPPERRADFFNRLGPEMGEAAMMGVSLRERGMNRQQIQGMGVGATVTKADEQNLLDYRIQQNLLGNEWKKLTFELGRGLIPVAVKLLSVITGIVKGLNDLGSSAIWGILAGIVGALMFVATRGRGGGGGGIGGAAGAAGKALTGGGAIGGAAMLGMGAITGDAIPIILGVVGLFGRFAPILLRLIPGLGQLLLIVSLLTFAFSILAPLLKPLGDLFGGLQGKLKDILGDAYDKNDPPSPPPGSPPVITPIINWPAFPVIDDKDITWNMFLRLRTEPENAMDVISGIQSRDITVAALLKLRTEPDDVREILSGINDRNVTVHALLKLSSDPENALDILAGIQSRTAIINALVKVDTQEMDRMSLDKTLNLHPRLTEDLGPYSSMLKLDPEPPYETQRKIARWFEAMLKLHPESANDVQRSVNETYGTGRNRMLFLEANMALPVPDEVQRNIDTRFGQGRNSQLFMEANFVLPDAGMIQEDIHKITGRTNAQSPLDIMAKIKPPPIEDIRMDLDRIIRVGGEPDIKVGVDFPSRDRLQSDIRNRVGDGIRLPMGFMLPGATSILNALPDFIRWAIFGTTGPVSGDNTPIPVAPPPYAKDGGIAYREMYVKVAEGGLPEAVVPLRNAPGGGPLPAGGFGGGGQTINVGPVYVNGFDFSDPRFVENVSTLVSNKIAHNLRVVHGLGRV